MLYKFRSRMFEDPYRPYYEAYRDHVFRICHYHPEDETGGHVWLVCDDDPAVEVKGYVHLTDLVAVNK